ncbi:ABC transporter permease [Chloroflexota bacterium]
MRDYIVRRILLNIPTLFFITIIVFLLVRFVPGSALDIMVDEMAELAGAAEIDVEAIREMLGLDVPIYQQYGRWLGVWPQASGEISGVLEGNLGVSLWSGEPVRDMIFRRFPVSLELGLLSMIIAWTIALPIGIYSALRQDSVIDYGGRTLVLIWLAAPNFWLATMVVVYPSIWWGWTPPIAYIPFVENPAGNLLQFIIPAFFMGTGMAGVTARYTRTWMLEVLRQDYIRTAWAKGLAERTVVIRHALRNALIPLVTIVGMEIPRVLSGTVIMEQIFCLPGIGRLFIGALGTRDYPIISGVNTIVATIVLLSVLLVDISYAYLDPRIRYK